MANTEQVVQTAQQVGTLVALATLFAQNAWLAYKKSRNSTTRVAQRIEAQLHPNGGDSFRDAMNRVEAIVASVERKVVSVETKMDALTHEVTLQRALQRMIADMDDSFITWVAAPSGEWEFLSLGITKITGRQVESLKGANWLNMVDPRDLDKTEAKWWEAVQRKRDVELSFRIARPQAEAVSAVMRGYVAEAPAADLFAGWTGTIAIKPQ